MHLNNIISNYWVLLVTLVQKFNASMYKLEVAMSKMEICPKWRFVQNRTIRSLMNGSSVHKWQSMFINFMKIV